MLGKIVIAFAAVTLLGAASIPTDAVAFGHGVGGGGGGHASFGGGGFGRGGFGGGGFARGFAGGGFAGGARGFAAPGIAGRNVGGGVASGFAGRGFAGRDFDRRGFERGFRGRRFARGFLFGPAFGLGLGYGAYSYYDDSCYAWTPYGYTWVCGYNYGY